MKIFYVSYTGMLEPLGESQVISYLVQLAEKHSITLLSFEKPEDLENQEAISRIQSICNEYAIEWVIKKYRHRPRLLATLMDIIEGVWSGKKIVKERNVGLIHARSHIPAFMALILKKISGTPFIFDMRSFWPEEMVNAGRLKENSNTFKVLKSLEKACIEECSHLVTLTNTSVKFLDENGWAGIEKKSTVIPTCVDLNQFSVKSTDAETGKGLTLGVVGTVTGWVDLKGMLLFFRHLKKQKPESRMCFLTKDDPDHIKMHAKELELDLDSISVKGVPFHQVSSEMKKMDAGIFFYRPHESELARSPTKMAEFLACGIPCVANSGVGDVEEIITKYNVGVVVQDGSKGEWAAAAKQIGALVEEEDTASRCRKAAVELFSLDEGVEKYLSIYKKVPGNE